MTVTLIYSDQKRKGKEEEEEEAKRENIAFPLCMQYF
jgi:hypothetical protein